MNKYDIAVFDVDGTLLDTKPGILKAIREMLRLQGLRDITPEEIPMFIGPPIQDTMKKVFHMSVEEAQECANVFRGLYKQEGYLLEAKRYPGIMEVCEELQKRDIKVAIATFKREDYAINICRHFGFHRYSDVIHGADNNNKLKKPDIIRLCLEDMNCKDYSRAVMIGDSSYDALGAQGLGLDFIGVTYGFDFKSTEDVMKYPSIGSADSTEELLKFF